MKIDVHDPFGEKESCLESKMRKYSLSITKKRSKHKNFFKTGNLLISLRNPWEEPGYAPKVANL